MSLIQGQIVGKYELLSKLGGGAFGEVWLARHVELAVERALKVPTDPQFIRQLRAEGRIGVSLNHPNIVQTFDLDTGADPPHVVMEYVQGADLRKRLRASGRLPPEQAMGILAQLLQALDHAHNNGVIHRDLKPENILIDPAGKVKVTDFGLGKVQADAASIVLSQSLAAAQGSLVGTVDYMSPEQKAGGQPSVQDDICAVGVIACELFTGARPTGNVARLLQRAGVDGQWASVVENALEERAYRYADAATMGDALRQAARPARQASSPVGPLPAPVGQAFLPVPPASPAGQAFLPVPPASPAGQAFLPVPPPSQRTDTNVGPTDLPREISLDLGRGVTMRFALIPPGTFLMGSPPGEKGRYEDETQHQVTISKPFYMGITPVTQEQYEAMMGVNPSYFHAKPGWLSRLFGAVEDSAARQRPVEQVSWSNAMDFCKKLSARINKTVSLPTEAQWEYACRAGTTGPYAGSGNLDDMAWYLSNSGGTPHPVGQKKPNAWGLHDMHGNVWEWCSDWYDKYPSHAVTDPTGPGNGQSRVLRGGSWDYIRDHCRAAYRRRGAPGLRSGYIGFRVCLDLD